MTIIRIAGAVQGANHKATPMRGGKRCLDTKLITLMRLALADALNLRRMQAV
jgi:hypothetical protein